MTKQKRLTSEEKDSICSRYLAGESSIELAKVFGITDSGVTYTLRKNKVAVRPYNVGRQAQLDETVFDIVTDESAYWIGFLMADGYVAIRRDGSKDSHYLMGLELKNEDKSHVEKFQKFLKTSYSITCRDRKAFGKVWNPCRIQLYSKRLVYSVSRHGVVPNKSLIASPGATVENSRHFWRGMIDGDGTIHLDKKGFSRLSIVGSIFTVESFLRFLKGAGIETKASPMKIKSKGNETWSTTLVGSQADAAIKLLYEDAPVYLERKYQKAQEMLQDKEKPDSLESPVQS